MVSNAPEASILLVDDEPLVTAALARHFSKHRHEILRATSAEEAFRILERRPVDVVVSDERMPGLSGSEFLGVVRRRFPDSIRMILSGQASLEAAVRAINEGEVYRFFLKPCNPTDLLFTIEKAVAHKRLEARSRELLREFRKQAAVLESLERNRPGLLHLQLDDSGALVIEESDVAGDVEDLLREMEESMAITRQRQRGSG